jgi:hypothetical protein
VKHAAGSWREDTKGNENVLQYQQKYSVSYEASTKKILRAMTMYCCKKQKYAISHEAFTKKTCLIQ